MKPTFAEIAYAAGFFDGEGSIMIWRRTGDPSDLAGRKYHRLMLTVRQVDRKPLEWLQVRFGGSIHAAIVNPQSNARPSWDWCLSAKLAAKFLRQIAPYTVLKRERIEVALRFQATMGLNVTAGKKGWTAVTDEVWNERETLRNELMFLNRRGASAHQATSH